MPSEFKFSVAKPSLVNMIWPFVEEHISEPIKHSNDELDIDVIKQGILDGEVLLFLVMLDKDIIASMTLECITFPTGKTMMHISTVGGSQMSSWLDGALHNLHKLAKEQGCKEVYGLGRAGWTKVLKKHGYEQIRITLRKKLED